MVHSQFKMHDILDCDLVRRLIELFDKQIHGVDLLLGFLGGPFHNCLNRRNVIVNVAIIEQLFIIAEENIANDCVDNVNRNDEFNRVCDQVHVLVQSVDAFHLALEVLCFVLVRQRLAGGPRLGVLFQMATIVEGSERLREIFDGQGRFSLIAQTIANLHTIPTFVDAKKASHDHISFGILGDDLKAEVQGVLRMEWGRLHGCTDEQKC
ncbi:unnamed protein product [Sphagnum troendelagicum]|uniref:Uncharacterized protein n=1 Tax=Sphagnum troendelagicum TaxID=128251 RepID=A0ABP0U937_9BRYO